MEVVCGLGEDSSPIYGIDRSQVECAIYILIGKEDFDGILVPLLVHR